MEFKDAMDMSNIKPIRDIVYEYLRKAVMEGELRPGERIIEKEYAEKLKISRTPIREALRKLETEGFVEYIPRKGVVVKGFTSKDIIEIYAIRKSLEGLAMKYVVENINEQEIEKLKSLVKHMKEADSAGNIEDVFVTCQEFNEVILNASRMPRLRDLINTLHEYLERFRRITMAKASRRADAIKEHSQILDAILDKDAKRAEKLVWEHLEASQKVFFNNFDIMK
ncbi:MAG: GntR family transcriptional regulator [Caulobacteraceae bacterium]